MKLVYEVRTRPGSFRSRVAEEAVKKAKCLEIQVYEEHKHILLVWSPYYRGGYILYYVNIGCVRVYIPGVETIDDVLPVVKKLSPKIIKALTPIATKYLIAGKDAVNDEDVIRIVYKVVEGSNEKM
jgi:hypothetical protein